MVTSWLRCRRRAASGSLCFSVHVSSLKPGLAVIKLAVREDLLRLLPGLDILVKHQFLVIWMRSNAPVIREVANGDFPGVNVGDPTGNGVFDLGTAQGRRNGLIEIDVTGTVPMGNNFYGIFPGNSVTLPTDWRALAERFSFDDDVPNGGVPGSAVSRWDIHDDQTTREGHGGEAFCAAARRRRSTRSTTAMGGGQTGLVLAHLRRGVPDHRTVRSAASAPVAPAGRQDGQGRRSGPAAPH